jgi:hypothetical protein
LIIQITPDGYITLSGTPPVVGRKYTLEDAETGTAAQNKAFHALIAEYWRTGMHSYNVKTFDQFRDMIKRDLGAGFESFIYADYTGMHKVQTVEEIPAGIDRRFILGKLKSWADYTKKERRESLDRLIAEMEQAGVNSRKYQEIIAGMNENKA